MYSKNHAIARAFLNDTKNSLTYLYSFLDMVWDADAIKKFTITAHGMKSSLASIGEHKLSCMAKCLETAGLELDIPSIRKDTPMFIHELENLANRIENEMESKIAAEEDTEFLIRQLQVMKSDCISFNIRGAKKAIEELHNGEWTKETKEIINNLSTYLLHSSFDKAQKLAEDTIKGGNDAT